MSAHLSYKDLSLRVFLEVSVGVLAEVLAEDADWIQKVQISA